MKELTKTLVLIFLSMTAYADETQNLLELLDKAEKVTSPKCGIGCDDKASKKASPFREVSRAEWLPKCCQTQSTPNCAAQATAFMERMTNRSVDVDLLPREQVEKFFRNPNELESYFTKLQALNEIKDPDQKIVARREAALELNRRVKSHFQPQAFWTEFCSFNSGKMKSIKPETEFKSGLITIHDTEFAEGGDTPSAFKGNRSEYFKKLSGQEMRDLALLLEPEQRGADGLPKSPFDRDRVKIFSAYYFNRIINQWSDIGYHYLIGEETNSVFQGRSTGFEGAHAGRSKQGGVEIGKNRNNLGIALLGNAHQSLQSAPSRTAFANSIQAKTATEFVRKLSGQYQIPENRIVTHGHIHSKDCGHNYVEWLAKDFPGFNGATKLTPGRFKFSELSEEERLTRLRHYGY